MSWTREITIWCDLCAEWEQSSYRSIRKFRQDLVRQGWRHLRKKDLCPKHKQGNIEQKPQTREET